MALIISAHRIATMNEHMTVEQIAVRLNITPDDVEDYLDQAGRKGQGRWLLRCNKTGRHWHLHTERACYRKAMMVGLVDYDFGLTDKAPVMAMDSGDIDARIAGFRGRGWSLRRIGVEVGMSATAIHKRLNKMRGRA